MTNDEIDLKILAKQLKQVLANQATGNDDSKEIKQSINRLEDEVRAVSTDVTRQGVLQEDTLERIIKMSEGISGIQSEIAHKSDQSDVDEIKADIKTIKVAVRATNKDLPHRIGR